nr:hypothetical protein [Tanacetum cinerariifolium]
MPAPLPHNPALLPSTLPNRRSVRLPGYDYGRAGWYFVTIMARDRTSLFGHITPEAQLLPTPLGEVLSRPPVHDWGDRGSLLRPACGSATTTSTSFARRSIWKTIGSAGDAAGRRPRPAGRCARPRQNPAGAHPGAGYGFAVSPHPVHARFDADRHPGHRSVGGRPRHRAALVQVQSRPHFRQPGAGRRDKPHAAQNPGRPAGGHAGRPQRHLPAARGPARPLLAVRAHRLPHRAGGNGRAKRHHRHRPRRSAPATGRRRHSATPAAGAASQSQPRAAGLREPAGARHPAGYFPGKVYSGLRALGRGAARRAGADTVRQGAGAAARPLCGYAGRYSGAGPAGAAPPRAAEFQCRSREHHARRCRGRAAESRWRLTTYLALPHPSSLFPDEKLTLWCVAASRRQHESPRRPRPHQARLRPAAAGRLGLPSSKAGRRRGLEHPEAGRLAAPARSRRRPPAAASLPRPGGRGRHRHLPRGRYFGPAHGPPPAGADRVRERFVRRNQRNNPPARPPARHQRRRAAAALGSEQ